jgi:Flp pilus assembly protein TadD
MSEDPSGVQSLLDDATGALAVGDLDEAANLFRQATEADATSFDAWHGLGMVLMRSGDLKAALGAAMMATDLRPNDLLGWTALSQIHVKMGNIAEAEAAKGNARIIGLGGRIVRDAP